MGLPSERGRWTEEGRRWVDNKNGDVGTWHNSIAQGKNYLEIERGEGNSCRGFSNSKRQEFRFSYFHFYFTIITKFIPNNV